jgi:hypothetical protein
MIVFVFGFILGALLAGGAVWLYERRQSSLLLDERNLLSSRLRSFIALLDSGLLTAAHPEVREMLVETQSMIEEGMAADSVDSVRDAPGPREIEYEDKDALPITRRGPPVIEEDEDESSLPGIFTRRQKPGGEDESSARKNTRPGEG